MDLILRNCRLDSTACADLVDIGIERGCIVAIAPRLNADARSIDCAGQLVSSGLIETHIHLDKSAILDRCKSEHGDLNEAIAEVARVKAAFTPEDVYNRGKATLERCIAHGTTHMRTQLEVDPAIGLRGLHGILPLIDEYKWAIDIEICVFPQEGLLNNPGTDELMVAALRQGARVIGAAPYTDSDPRGQIDRIFTLAREFDIDIDMHLDFGADPSALDLEYVCELTARFGYGGRVTVGHVDFTFNPWRAFGSAANETALEAERHVHNRRRTLAQPVLPGVVALLDAARAAKLSLAIASNSSHEHVEGHLTRLGLHAHFEFFACRGDAPSPKPEPDLYKLVLNRFGLRGHEAVAFEDSRPGSLAAKRANLWTVAAPNSSTAHHDFTHVDVRVASLAEVTLEKLVEGFAEVAARKTDHLIDHGLR